MNMNTLQSQKSLNKIIPKTTSACNKNTFHFFLHFLLIISSKIITHYLKYSPALTPRQTHPLNPCTEVTAHTTSLTAIIKENKTILFYRNHSKSPVNHPKPCPFFLNIPKFTFKHGLVTSLRQKFS